MSAPDEILWKTYTVPSNNSDSDSNLPGFYSGNGVWGSSPVVDTRRGLLYVGTANNFSAPPGVCLTPEETGCEESGPDNHFDAIVALRLTRRRDRLGDADAAGRRVLRACLCGPDLDFGAAPNLFTITDPDSGRPRQVLGIGQKSGVYWALNPDDGSLVWSTKVGPGGLGGGVEFGTATDDERIYVAEGNSSRTPFTLSGTGPFAGLTVTSGYLVGAESGDRRHPVADARSAGLQESRIRDRGKRRRLRRVGRRYRRQHVRAGRHTGAVLWSFASGGSVFSAPAVVHGKLFWGSGYTRNACVPERIQLLHGEQQALCVRSSLSRGAMVLKSSSLLTFLFVALFIAPSKGLD